ncbi:MAG: exodeoxyribonuclease large subunit [Actinomycetota bacterium]
MSDVVDVGEGPAVYGVGELIGVVNGVLADGFRGGVWVRGEIQSWKDRGAHAYFDIVDELDGKKATLSVKFFAPQRNRLRALLQKSGLQLADGLKVCIHGDLDVYAPSGSFGFKMDGIDPNFSLGDLALQRDAVLLRLSESGMLRRNGDVPLSVAPLRVGVVTSESSAAWADFHHEIERSGFGFVLRLLDVRVQGPGAVDDIAGAIRALGSHADLDAIAVIRGGGGKSELAVFDQEAIAVAIAESPLPVLTGIGHEVDHSVADAVAHLALKTPTACAAALAERVGAFVQAVETAYAGVERRALLSLQSAAAEVASLAEGIGHRVSAAVIRSDERLAERARRLHTGTARVLERADSRLVSAAAAVARAPQRLEPELRHLDGLAGRVRLLDPAFTMARGWSITRTADGRTVRTAADLQPGDHIVTTFATGTARSRVEETTA